MREPLSNIGMTCVKHSPKPDKRYFKKPFIWFVNKHVKLGFRTGLKNPSKEHMWVMVTGKIREKNKTRLIGYLDNDPFFCNLKNGDIVNFDRTDVEVVMS